MRVVLYCRVSTRDQNCEMQLRELREYAERRGWEIAGEYVDQGWSGSKDRRPRLDALMRDARRRAFDCVAVWRLDRLARSVKHLTGAAEEFQSLGVQFVSLHESVDTTTPNGRLVFHIFASIAEFERELIRERVLSGLKNAKARGTRSGKAIGRPRRVFSRDEALRLRGEGLSYPQIARRLGISTTTAYRTAAV